MMPVTVQNSHKLVSLIAAVAVTFGLQGSLLAGFSHLADQTPAPVLANCSAVTPAAVTVVPGRG